MGTEIELTVGGITIDYSKNHMGIDHGFLFQERDRTRCRSDAIDYEYFEANPQEDLSTMEAAFVRPLNQVLPRLDITGYTIEAARAEYEEIISESQEMDLELGSPQTYMSFDEFCEFCGQFPLEELDTTYIDFDDPDRDIKSQGRFVAISEELSCIPQGPADMYWSERSFFGATVGILSPYSMLQVFGQNYQNQNSDVVWQYGPLVEAGWAKAEDFNHGARRKSIILVATEGTSDSRIIKHAIEALRPDTADFFSFIDVNERHHFWGTGSLTKFAEGLVRIDIQNKILFVLDNDVEGLEAYRRLLDLNMPKNMRAMTLPDLEIFKQFPARGPEGVNVSNINSCAAGIECYLDLNLPQYPPAKVLWTNYKPELDKWHGALEHKDSYAKFFYKQSASDLTSEQYDTTKLLAILDAVLVEAIKMGGG